VKLYCVLAQFTTKPHAFKQFHDPSTYFELLYAVMMDLRHSWQVPEKCSATGGASSVPLGRFAVVSSCRSLRLVYSGGLNNTVKRRYHRQFNWSPASRMVTTVTPGLHSLRLAELGVLADASPKWTLDQIAGLVFAAFLLFVYASSQIIVAFVARAQRRQLGLCEKCGGLYTPESCPYSEEGECT
jgi:hypothetical protein